MKHYFAAAGILAALTFSSATNAAPIIYHDRTQFIQAASPQVSIDFESATPGASFENQPLAVGNMTLQGGSHFENLATVNVIAPGGNCNNSFSVNGSTHACGYVSRDSPLRIDFLAPVVSWGADFSDLGDETRETALRFYGGNDNLLGEVIAKGNMMFGKTFLGVDLQGSLAAYMLFEFVGIGNDTPEDAFGMDNVIFSTDRGDVTPVPLPASFLLLGGSIAGLAGLRGRARKRRPHNSI